MFIPYSKKYIKKYWEKSNARIHGSTNKLELEKNYLKYAIKIKSLIFKKEKIKEILDVGCADGELSQQISFIFKDSNVDGLEQSKTLLDKYKVKKIGKAYLQSCTERWTNINKKYDLIILNGVLQYLNYDEVKKLSYNISSSLKKDGQLVIVGICDFDKLHKWYLKDTDKKSKLYKVYRYISFGGLGALLTSRLWPDGTMWHDLKKIKKIFGEKFNYIIIHSESQSYRFDMVCFNEKV